MTGNGPNPKVEVSIAAWQSTALPAMRKGGAIFAETKMASRGRRQVLWT